MSSLGHCELEIEVGQAGTGRSVEGIMGGWEPVVVMMTYT